MNIQYRYHHTGIPTTTKMPGMVHLEHLKIYATDHESNPFGIQWMLYEEGCNQPELVRTVPHVAFEVDDLQKALEGKKIITPPNSPSPGVLVAMIEEAGAPVEFLQFEKNKSLRYSQVRMKRSATPPFFGAKWIDGLRSTQSALRTTFDL